jgi:adenylylsulfate kinase
MMQVFNFLKDSRVRHITKSITWRIIGTIDTMVIAWLVTGKLVLAFTIGSVEVFTKIALYYFHERAWYRINFGLDRKAERLQRVKKNGVSKDILTQNFNIKQNNRIDLLKQKPLLIWFTGLSGSGKSTMANLLERQLNSKGFKTYILDGDNIRGGLCKDLNFSGEDRTENIRRIGEVSKLFLDCGIIVLCAFVSPFAEDRQLVKNLVGPEMFIEIFVDCPIEICEQRDVKGLYKKARQGTIKNFTGIDSPFEVPQNPDIILKTAIDSPDILVNNLLAIVTSKISINQNVGI